MQKVVRGELRVAGPRDGERRRGSGDSCSGWRGGVSEGPPLVVSLDTSVATFLHNYYLVTFLFLLPGAPILGSLCEELSTVESRGGGASVTGCGARIRVRNDHLQHRVSILAVILLCASDVLVAVVLTISGLNVWCGFSVFMTWLQKQVRQLGGTFEQRRVTDFDEENCDLLVNCSGAIRPNVMS